MSAPDTNIDKQTKRHIVPLVGIAAVVVMAGLLFMGLFGFTVSQGDDAVEQPAPQATATD